MKYTLVVNNGSYNNINLGDSTISKMSDKRVNTAFKAAGKIVESGADLISAPVTWLKDMQQNWLVYMILIAIILITTAFLYCAVRSFFSTKRSGCSANSLIEMVTAVANRNQRMQIPISNSTPNSSSTRPAAIGDLTI